MTQAIFLSYASQDADSARRICDALRAAGLEVWFDQSELRGGDAWDASIRKQIKECALFVPMISSNTQAREEGYFRFEWKLAVDRSHLMADNKAFFFPIVIDDTFEAAAKVPDRFRERQWTRVTSDQTTEAFATRIAKVIDGSASSGTNAASAPPTLASSPGIIATATTKADDTPSVAVLAFANLSASADDEYFSDGLADELLNVLAKIKGLRVAARTSAFSFKGKQTTVEEIARVLNVATVLDGSVRKSGNRVRISVQLIKAKDGFQLWSESYDRMLEDIFAVQDDIAQAVVTRLRGALLGQSETGNEPEAVAAIAKEIAETNAHRGDNTEVQRLLLEARFLLQQRTTESIARGIGLCEQALVLEPDNANTHAELSTGRLFVTMYTGQQRRDTTTKLRLMHRAKEHAELALAINPNVAYAYKALGYVAWLTEHDAAARIEAHERALAVAPDEPEILRLASLWRIDFGRFDEAHALLERAKKLDPLSALIPGTETILARFARRTDESITFAKRALELNPDLAWAFHHLAYAAWIAGQHDLAAESFARTAELQGNVEFASRCRQRYAEAGWETFLRAIIADRSGLYFGDYTAAAAFAALGDFDAAFAALDECVANYNQAIGGIKFDPVLDPLRADPRYAALIVRLGFPE